MNVETRVAWPAEGYAGFWQRVAGYLVDALLFTVVVVVIAFAVAAMAASEGAEDPEAVASTVNTTVNLLGAIAFFIYDTVLTSRYGATLGKRAAGIEVRMPDGTLPSYARCVGRYFARIVSALPLGLGYLWVAWDERKQTFHDKIVTTVVVRSRSTQPAAGVSSWATGPAATGGWGAPSGAHGFDGAGGGGSPAPWDAGSGAASEPSPAGTEPPHGERVPGGLGSGGPAAGPGTGGAPPGTGDEPAAARGLTGPTMETARWDTAARPSTPAPAGTAGEAGEAEAAAGAEAGELPADAPEGAGPPAGQPAGSRSRPDDPNVVAIERASLSQESTAWLRQVAGQVDPRLDRVRPDWERSPQAAAARACAFGILLGHLARLHPHMRGDLGRVAEAHPSFSTLLEGSRLATLEQIAAEPARATAWLGPLLDVEERDRIAALLA